MDRYRNIRILCLQLLLLVSFSQRLMANPMIDPVHGRRSYSVHSVDPGPLCVDVEVPKAGRWWAILRTIQPSTAPALIVLGTHGSNPRTAMRVEAVLLEVDAPDELTVCTTSRAMLRGAEIIVVPEGDPLEIEVDPDPWGQPGGALAEEGLREIEVDPDP